MKKMISILLTAAVLFNVFSGCATVSQRTDTEPVQQDKPGIFGKNTLGKFLGGLAGGGLGFLISLPVYAALSKNQDSYVQVMFIFLIPLITVVGAGTGAIAGDVVEETIKK